MVVENAPLNNGSPPASLVSVESRRWSFSGSSQNSGKCGRHVTGQALITARTRMTRIEGESNRATAELLAPSGGRVHRFCRLSQKQRSRLELARQSRYATR